MCLNGHAYPWLNWIEHLATDQGVGGSSPSGYAISLSSPSIDSPCLPVSSETVAPSSTLPSFARPALLILSGIACDMHRLPGFGASIGASVREELADTASCSLPVSKPMGNAGNVSNAPATSSNFGSVYTLAVSLGSLCLKAACAVRSGTPALLKWVPNV